MTHHRNIILASTSPRRQQLLRYIEPQFVIAPNRDVEEVYPRDLPAEDVPAYLSHLKADAHRPFLTPDDILITADTIVVLDGKILGKPHDDEQAVEMLRRLSGRTHTVVTGVTLTTTDCQDTFTAKTRVTFDDIPEEDICWYVEKYQPLDKAGAYGIQEWIGAAGIKGIEGSFYNVMGLPLHQLYKHLRPMLNA